MVMSVQEIAKSYQESKDKGAQIGILADLNDCDKEQIIVVLKGQGITDIPAPMAKRGRKSGKPNNKIEKPKKLVKRPKNNRVNALIFEGIAAIDEEMKTLQTQLDIHKKKKDLLAQALEIEEVEENE